MSTASLVAAMEEMQQKKTTSIRPPTFNYLKPTVQLSSPTEISKEWASSLCKWFSHVRTSLKLQPESYTEPAFDMITRLIESGELPVPNYIFCIENIADILHYLSKRPVPFTHSDLSWLFFVLVFMPRYLEPDVTGDMTSVLDSINDQILKNPQSSLKPYLCTISALLMHFFHTV